ncbi:hypothetical protein V8C42DRAFT_315021 [Trichoderma barbatum]
MAFDEFFLSPRGLLVNNDSTSVDSNSSSVKSHSSFVCNGPNFSKLQQATQATLDLPFTDQRMGEKIGFTAKGSHELYSDIIIPAMDDFYKIAQQSMNLEVGYRSIGDVCKVILELSAAAQEVYDDIFDALERLYGDESGNDSLREEVQATMKDRLDKLTYLSNLATEVASNLRDAIGNVTEAQILIKNVGTDLQSPNIIERLRTCHEGDYDSAEFDIDCNAVEIFKKLIDTQNMQDDSGASMENLQQAVGAAVDIWNDLTALSTYVAEHTEPGPGPLLNLQKNKLLEMWSDLATEVQNFLDYYMG